MYSTLVKRTHILIAKIQKSSKIKHYAQGPRGIDWQEKTIARPRSPLIRMHKPGTLHVSNLLHNFTHTCMLRDSQFQHKYFSNSQLSTSSLILLPPYLKTIIKHQISLSIQNTHKKKFTNLEYLAYQDYLRKLPCYLRLSK